MAHIDEYLKQIVTLRNEADELPEDNPGALIRKLDLLKNCFMYIGRVSAMMDGEYKRIYALRKYEQAQAFMKADKHREAASEVAVHERRMEEAKAHEDMSRWRNAKESTQEEINLLKLKLRMDLDYKGGAE